MVFVPLTLSSSLNFLVSAGLRAFVRARTFRLLLGMRGVVLPISRDMNLALDCYVFIALSVQLRMTSTEA